MSSTAIDGLVRPKDYFIKYFTDEGEPYYCSISTDETSWEPPNDAVLGMLHSLLYMYLYIHVCVCCVCIYICTYIHVQTYILTYKIAATL